MKQNFQTGDNPKWLPKNEGQNLFNLGYTDLINDTILQQKNILKMLL